MYTITFYSYKGGVGRTLTLANIAKQLCEFKKRVVILDLDLEAPGLYNKFKTGLDVDEPTTGIVDYIYQYAIEHKIPMQIKPYSKEIKLDGNNAQPICIIPAGDIKKPEYWRKLVRINWHQLFYQPESEGIPFFLDLKQKIQKEFDPDFLLIDSRTGITELSGLSVNVMADEIVMVASNNDENLTGIKMVARAISEPANNLMGHKPKIHFVLTRIPQFGSIENRLVKRIQKELNEITGCKNKDLCVIHSDRDLEMSEKLKIGYNKFGEVSQVSQDYVKLFVTILEDKLSAGDNEKLQHFIEFQRLINRAQRESGIRKVKYYTSALLLEPNSAETYYNRFLAYYYIGYFNNALSDLDKAITLSDTNDTFYAHKAAFLAEEFNRPKEALETIETALSIKIRGLNLIIKGDIMRQQQNIGAAIRCYKKAIALEPDNVDMYIDIADLYLENNNLSKSKVYAHKILELDPFNYLGNATLAEILALEGDEERFYLHMDLALQGHKSKNNLSDEFDLNLSIKRFPKLYKTLLNQERFKKLLRKHHVKLEA